MSPEIEILIIFSSFLGLLIIGMSVPIAIAIPGLIYLYLQGGMPALNSLGFITWGSMNSFTLTAVPLFIFMAEILGASGLSSRIYKGLSKLVAPLPGGLLQTNIAGSALFASVSGSSVATAASLGRVALPQLLARNYSQPLAAGSLAAGGTLGILIPPSIAMIIYGTFTQTSVPQLFMAGLIPGLMLTGLFMLYLAVHALIIPSAAPREKGIASMAEFIKALGEVAPFILLIGGTIGLLYGGFVTTTEAATIGCSLAIIIGFVFGNLTWSKLLQAARVTIIFVGNILFLVLAAYIFSAAVSFSGIGEDITEFVTGLELTRLQFFLCVFLLLTLLGCLIESLGIIVIMVPLLYPMLGHYDIDPLLFGVVVVLFVELAQITPPMGINIFIIQSIWEGKLGSVIRGTIPFCLLILLAAFLVIGFPELALWLPNQMLP
ncbi:TRAP transporter large permease [Telmatospirillum sp. J64-1]|uniref:TRAP transporter large permease n=1 Tax=Telmatospirillum sp. J64-1 TaxID=2502183 RepID=UPI00115D7D3A|nr:TRAP transporter large permease [Telmatospirillum sp. J64-1]